MVEPKKPRTISLCGIRAGSRHSGLHRRRLESSDLGQWEPPSTPGGSLDLAEDVSGSMWSGDLTASCICGSSWSLPVQMTAHKLRALWYRVSMHVGDAALRPLEAHIHKQRLITRSSYMRKQTGQIRPRLIRCLVPLRKEILIVRPPFQPKSYFKYLRMSSSAQNCTLCKIPWPECSVEARNSSKPRFHKIPKSTSRYPPCCWCVTHLCTCLGSLLPMMHQ